MRRVCHHEPRAGVGRPAGLSRAGLLFVAGVFLLAACTGGAEKRSSDGPGTAGGTAAGSNDADRALVSSRGRRFPPAPEVPEGPLSPEAAAAVEDLLEGLSSRGIDSDAIATLADGGDSRVLWFLRDLLRFSREADREAIMDAFDRLTGTTLPREHYNEIADHLIAWDLPAPPGYTEMKRRAYVIIEPGWAPFFDAEPSKIDWRLVEWGGVLIDDRPDASPGVPCDSCIPALDDPPVTDAAGGRWYPAEALVFGVVVDGEARAYPKNIMEVHEMVNDTLGGRRIGMPYCTLCLAAQVYFTDDVPGFEPVLRTSGLLSRSNKFTYDISTMSAIDTFTGEAISGPLLEAGARLKQASVITTTWAEWKEAYPDTTIVAADGGVPGRIYPVDPLRGRDDAGPIFPVGNVDPRLPIQERVLGVIASDGTPVAFPVENASLALRAGEAVELAGVRVELDAGGLRALVAGEDASSHEAFWFAWSQFYPDTLLWERG